MPAIIIIIIIIVIVIIIIIIMIMIMMIMSRGDAAGLSLDSLVETCYRNTMPKNMS